MKGFLWSRETEFRAGEPEGDRAVGGRDREKPESEKREIADSGKNGMILIFDRGLLESSLVYLF